MTKNSLKRMNFRLTIKRFTNNQYYLYLVALVLYEYVSLFGFSKFRYIRHGIQFRVHNSPTRKL